MTTETTNRPSHYVYAVRPSTRQGGKAFWTRIGAAWANRDGEGFSVKLDLVPINGSEIVIRTSREDREEDRLIPTVGRTDSFWVTVSF